MQNFILEAALTVLLTVPAYLVTILIIAAVRALIALRKGTGYAKQAFQKTFWNLFTEMLNPLNWF